MLVSIQKKLNLANCPSCGKNKVLQASLSCSRDEKKCEPICHCIQCGISLKINIPEGTSIVHENNSVSVSCDLLSASCNLTIQKAA